MLTTNGHVQRFTSTPPVGSLYITLPNPRSTTFDMQYRRSTATLRHRSAREQPEEVTHAAAGMEPLLECVMQLAHVALPFCVPGKVVLQRGDHDPMFLGEHKALGLGDCAAEARRPVLRGVREHRTLTSPLSISIIV